MKFCKYFPDRVCCRPSCSFLDGMGNVVPCRLVPNPDGFFMRRKVGHFFAPLFNKHLKGKKVVVFG